MTIYKVERFGKNSILLYKNGKVICKSALPLTIEDRLHQEVNKMRTLGLSYKVIDRF